jgi:hypothetical protein
MLKGIKLTALTPLQTGIAALIFAVVAAPLPTVADPFVSSTGDPGGLMATTSRPSAPGIKETETGNDFVLPQATWVPRRRIRKSMVAGRPLLSDLGEPSMRLLPIPISETSSYFD